VTLRFILNPRSGPAAGRSGVLPLLTRELAVRQLTAEIRVTEHRGHATELAREAVQAGVTRVVAVGGDGTINEVAQALVNTPVALGLVPRGSGNGLARHLGISLRPAQAIALAIAPAARIGRIDSGSVNGRAFFNVMGLGLDADISHRFSLSHRRGLPVYVWTALVEYLKARPERCVIHHPGGTETVESLLTAVANSPQYGNGAIIAPGAEVDDGVLDLVCIRPPGLLRAAGLGVRLFAGSLDRSGRVRRWRGAHFVIERAAPGMIHVDGEALPQDARLEIRLLPKSLAVVLP
jgi:YegS/Rv2252/BmrU family lipid kinase